jgi:hypothetical protein
MPAATTSKATAPLVKKVVFIVLGSRASAAGSLPWASGLGCVYCGAIPILKLSSGEIWWP